MSAPAVPSNACALIIGIDDYRGLDPSGGADLAGACADAVAWWRLATGHLGLAPARVRVLAQGAGGAPVVLPDGSTAGPATKAAVIAGLQWLEAQLEGGVASAIFAYSGHGVGLRAARITEEGNTLALVPADATRDAEGLPTLDSLITATTFASAIPTQAGRVTAFVDACDNRAGHRGQGSLSGVEGLPPRVFSRLFLASELGQSADEIRLAEGWRGAFSHAVQSLIARWSVVRDPASGVHFLNASHSALAYRSHLLLDALGLDQSPTFVAALQRLSLAPVFRPGPALVPVSARPDAPTRGEEISPGDEGVTTTVLTIKGILEGQTTHSSLFRCILVADGLEPVTCSGVALKPGQESWFTVGDALKSRTADKVSSWKVKAQVFTSWASDPSSPEACDELPGPVSSTCHSEAWAWSADISTSWEVLTGGAGPLQGERTTALQTFTDQNGTSCGLQLAWDDDGALTTVAVYRNTTPAPAGSGDLVLFNASTTDADVHATALSAGSLPSGETWERIVAGTS